AAHPVRRRLRRNDEFSGRHGPRARRRARAFPRAHRVRRSRGPVGRRSARRRPRRSLGASRGRGARRDAAARRQRLGGARRSEGVPGRIHRLPGEARRPHPALAIPSFAAHARRGRSLRQAPSRKMRGPQVRLKTMSKARENGSSTKAAKERWASDVIVDLLHAYGLPHAALNPGASYRGLHDSIVNYGENRPTMMLCQHEETAVQIAHGYAVMMAEPRGPIYMCYDAWLQEQKLDHEVPLPPAHAGKVPSRLAPEPKALAAAADLIAASRKPVIIAEFVGREPEGFHALV